MSTKRVEDRTDISTQGEQYTFIQETIGKKKRTKTRRLLFTLVSAVLFGVVSGLVFCLSVSMIAKLCKIDRELIRFQSSEQPGTTSTPTPTITTTPSQTPQPSATPQPVQTQGPSTIIETIPGDMEDYISIYNELASVAKSVNRSIVTVTSVKSGMDVFNNPSENTKQSYGLVIANNGKELLLLVNSNRIESANYLKVTFGQSITVEASLYNSREELGIAIVAVSLTKIPNDVLETIDIAQLGESTSLSTGSPVIALGNPNGYMYSVQYGFVSNAVNLAYYTDGCVDLVNTTIPYNENGEGIIVNTYGKVVGIITNQASFKQDLNRNINTCLGISKLRTVIEDMVNDSPRMYFGMVGNDINHEIADKIGISSGIYVMEVKQDSPAYIAGLKKGDVITGVNTINISNVNVFSSYLATRKANEEVKVTIIRTVGTEKKELVIPVKLQEIK